MITRGEEKWANMVKYFDDGAHGNRIYYSAEGYFKPSYSITTLRELVKAIVYISSALWRNGIVISQVEWNVKGGYWSSLINIWKSSRSRVSKSFFRIFHSANRVYVLLTATKNWIEYDTARKGLQKGRYDLLMLV